MRWWCLTAHVEFDSLLSRVIPRPSQDNNKFGPGAATRPGAFVWWERDVSGLVVTYQGAATERFIRAAIDLGSPKLRTELWQGLDQGGRKVRTLVRKDLKEQMGVKRAGVVTAGTRSFTDRGSLTFTIVGTGKGLPIQEFPFRMSRSRGARVRWSPREHWRLQPRDAGGRFGELPDAEMPGAVSASPWRVSRTFQRSFVNDAGEPRAMLPGGRKRRRLFGAGIAKEIVEGQTAARFMASSGTIIEPIIVARLARVMP